MFQDHFSDAADGYAAYRPAYPAALVEFLAAATGRTTLAWDAGCGSGQLAALLGDRFEHVVATDASAAQLARARPHPRVEYRVARAEASGLAAGVVDLAVAAQAAHWFDPAAYSAEVRRVARPGALVAQTVYNLVEVDGPIDAAVRRYYDEVLRPYWPPERRHVETDYRSLPFPFAPVESRTFQMRATWTLEHFMGYLRSWSGVRAMQRALGPGPTEALRTELAMLWGRAETLRAVHWPLAVRAARI